MLARACSRRRFHPRAVSIAVLVGAVICGALSPARAAAFNPLKPLCKVAQLGSGAAGKLCGAVAAPGKLLKAGGNLVTGHFGSAAHAAFGGGTSGTSAGATAVGLAAIGVWVLGGAKFALHATATVLGHTTSPQLQSTWFSSSYWRMASIAALMTLPFLFAAAVQALLRSDLALLARAAFGYLPLALLAVGVAAPVTMLLLAASDQLSAIVAAAAGHESTHFLVRSGAAVGVLSVFKGSPFLAFLVGLIAAAGALVLWLELLMREAAVYIVVLMLPLAFAAMVWPARRIWAQRAVEVLVALIFAKFAIVAALALGGAALGHGHSGITGALAGAVLVLLGAFAPWALLRLMPLTELASGAAGSLRGHVRMPIGISSEDPGLLTGRAAGWAGALTAGMRRAAEDVRGHPHNTDSAHAEVERLDRLERVPVGVGAEGPEASAKSDPPAADRLFAVSSARAAASNGTAQRADPASDVEPITGPLQEPAADAGAPSQRSLHPDAGAPSQRSPHADAGAPSQRSPGMDAIWQAPDGAWRPLALGDEEPPAWLWRPDEGGRASDPRPSGEDHDPLPPRQEPEHGPL